MVTLKELNRLRDEINDKYSQAKQIQREAVALEDGEYKRLRREYMASYDDRVVSEPAGGKRKVVLTELPEEAYGDGATCSLTG